ncbi:MAG TPA: response regulator [Pyrinomonadaceae bacterium]|nr:response regulator [Pyrinomonadaceae bacterium]
MIQRSRVILYLEDNRMLREMVCDVLEFAGWYVKPSPDRVHTWAMLDCSKEHFDLLLIDQEVHGIDGLELVRRVRRMPHRRETPIILISLEDIEAEAREAGADAFLRKPNNLIELVDTISGLLAAPAGA